MKLFIVGSIALASAETTNECDACWEMGENGQCVPAAGKISTVCGSNTITMTIDACVIDTPYVSNRKDRIYRISYTKHKFLCGSKLSSF